MSLIRSIFVTCLSVSHKYKTVSSILFMLFIQSILAFGVSEEAYKIKQNNKYLIFDKYGNSSLSDIKYSPLFLKKPLANGKFRLTTLYSDEILSHNPYKNILMLQKLSNNQNSITNNFYIAEVKNNKVQIKNFQDKCATFKNKLIQFDNCNLNDDSMLFTLELHPVVTDHCYPSNIKVMSNIKPRLATNLYCALPIRIPPYIQPLCYTPKCNMKETIEHVRMLMQNINNRRPNYKN